MPTDWSSTMWTTGWRATDGDPRSRAGEDPEPASYLKGASQPKQVRPAYAGVETSLAIFTASATVTAGPLRFSYTPYGRPAHPETVSQGFDRRVRRPGLPRIRFHDLRHMHATLALAA